MKARLYKEVTTKAIYYVTAEVDGWNDKSIKASDDLDWKILYPAKISWEGIVSVENLDARGEDYPPHYEEPHP